LKNQNQTHRALRCSAALIALLLPAIAAPARVHKSRTWADSQFANAEHLQDTLEARPTVDRTRHDYERVINAYRRVYLGAPSSSKADPSVVAAAQMTEEMGRRFTDPDVLRSAIQQYEFLRREYPGSKYRFDALFRIGEIYKGDLHDKPRAEAAFEEFLRRYPRNQFAAAARQALAEPMQPASLKSKAATKASIKDSKDSDADPDSDDGDQDNSNKQPETEVASVKPARVLGIRHWSTPDYTRVAIDLEHAVKYQSQRIDSPDRIFFDLQNTKLDPRLSGKSFDVSDGLLKSIRTSQFKAGRTRVVLDLDEVSEASASLLANPSRLIIDIRNKGSHKPETVAEDNSASQPTDDVGSDAPVRPAAERRQNFAEPSPPEKAAAAKPAPRTTVVLSNGVKKTIVDAEDDDAVAKNTIAKLDAPKPDNSETRNNPGSDLSSADHVEADASVRPATERRQDTSETPPPLKASTRKRGRAEGKHKMPAEALDVREAQPTASGDRSLIRALGLKIGKIVIDPGHGGHDTGTIGPNGLEEKDLVLDVSRRLGKLLQTRLGAEVIYTRRDDTFIPLETRTAIANQEAADLFVSVHANSSRDSDARGVETYYLNFTSSPDALEVAARENAVSEESIHELQDLVKKIALKEKIEESHEFASDVQHSLHSGLAARNPGLRDRGVKKAPFIVLIGANMPSILAEISFVSNPGDERRLETADYRQKIAESLYRGIAKYVSGLSGVKVASKIDKDQGQ
jgi:N-acetylmuramoyl-L-alanine amidase